MSLLQSALALPAEEREAFLRDLRGNDEQADAGQNLKQLPRFGALLARDVEPPTPGPEPGARADISAAAKLG